MEKIKIKTRYKKLLADTITPVSIYLQIRDRYNNAIMLESSDYHGNENSYSYICCEPMATFSLVNNKIIQTFPGQPPEESTIPESKKLMDVLRDFSNRFEEEKLDFKFITNGLFGYIQYDGVTFFEDIQLHNPEPSRVPLIHYAVYKNMIVVDHFKNELYIFEHYLEGEPGESGIPKIEMVLNNKNIPSYGFKLKDEESSNYTDSEFLDILSKGRDHCFRGDVFQIVLSRSFSTGFEGDEFNVYRALRSINPSPYLFYFDYGSFKVFGSSPEAQIVVKGNKATIYPIAGTFKRTGNDQADAELARKLYDDPKENSEHVMLVDLARNDLSRSSEKVNVE
ncbi:MAG: chorismate-binding protein, partial [Cyclobacteriaceae bacterium]